MNAARRFEPMLLLVWGLPAAAVLAGFLTLWLALRAPDPLVRDDLRKQGLTYAPPAADSAPSAESPPTPPPESRRD